MPGNADVFRRALQEGMRAAGKNLPAILLLQATAIALVVAYFTWPPLRPVADAIAESKKAAGLPGAFIAGAIAGAVIPEIAKALTKRPHYSLTDSAFVALVYGTVGVIVDLFYTQQGVWFGTTSDFPTVAKKLAVDMLIVAPIVFVPFSVGAFMWKEQGFRLAALRGLFTWETFWNRIFSIQVMNWLVWIPVLSALYALPVPLQFPLAMLVEAVWSLIMVVMASGGVPAQTETTAT